MVARQLLAVGDSHLEALQFAADLRILNVENTHFLNVPGATVIGLRNPNSQTDAVNLFKSFLRLHSADSHLLVHLGEVDCGFVMWWRAQKYGEGVDSQFRESISAYRQFLAHIMTMGFRRICLTGASLPTIDDNVNMSEVANKRSEISVGIVERTRLTFRYNSAVSELARDRNLSYFDISDAVLNRSSGVVHEFFRNRDPRNHHLDKLKTVGIWAERCNAFLNGRL